MMKGRTRNQLLLALAACLTLVAGHVWAQEEAAETAAAEAPDTSKWVCKFCPPAEGWFGEWSLGILSVDDPTPKFADYRGLDDDGAYADVGGDSSYRNDNGYYFDFYGRDLGLDSRRLDMRGGKQGYYEFRAAYQEIPRYQGHGTVSPYLGVGTDLLVLPPSWQTPGRGDEANAALLQPVALESKREIAGAGLSVRVSSAWDYFADFERQTRTGTNPFGGGVFPFNGTLFPKPLDYTTDRFTTGLEYTGRQAQWRVVFEGSDFDNGFNSVTWQNPYARGFGDEYSRAALAPDNEYYQVSLAGAVRFSPRVRFSGKAAFGNFEQNDPFLPYSINPEYEDLPLPRASLDGKLESFMLNLSGRLYMKLADRLDLTASYKLDERDNQTPIDSYSPILFEVFRGTPRSNRPYSYDREKTKLELRYRAGYKLRLNAGAQRYTVTRTYQEVYENDEDSYWGEAQFSPWAWMDARLKLETGERDATPSVQQGNFDRAEHPLMRKYYMAKRDRDRATLEIDLYPSERFSINLSYYTTEDDYTESVIGLRSSEEESLSIDLSFAVNDKATLYAFATQDDIDAEISAAASFQADPWTSMTRDEVMTWGVGFSGRFGEKFSYGLDFVSSDADGNIATDSGDGEAPFPVLTTELRNTRIYLHYAVSERWGLGLDAYREEYDSADWYVDGIGPFDVDGLLNMGDDSPDYEVNVVRVLATVSF